jgi:diadenosine tetraphosphate (Ap4A) HIT family hydrolase
MNRTCPLCEPNLDPDTILFENGLCLFVRREEPVLIGSGLIIPRQHRETVFELTPEEVSATFELLVRVKDWIDLKHAPSGYNLGWNCGRAAGQEVFHAHLHVIPRHGDEPLVGKGIRYWLKQDTNRRPAR